MARKRKPKDPLALPDPAEAPRRAGPPRLDLGALAGWSPPDAPRTPAQELRSRTVEEAYGPEYVSAYAVERARAVAAELARRRVEGLELYEPLPVQAAFLACPARYRLVRGSNRSGKTLVAAVEVARALTGRDPFGKYPLRDGVCFAVGRAEQHVGEVMYRKLFRAGAVRMIRDEATGRWRAFRPWEDREREAFAKPAPPLIPPRMVLETAWTDKKKNVPGLVRLATGWEVHFFSSLGKPPKGSAIDLFWFDEEIVDPSWYPEMAARIVDRRGRGVWSFTPEAGTEQAYELHERAEKERVLLPEGKRTIVEFESLLADNRHLDDEAKKALAQDLSEEEARVKVGGEYAFTGYRVYPTFSMAVHGADPREVPPHWTCYGYVDPGHRVCAALFAAVPPPDEGDWVLLYDELYLYEATAASFAEAMKNKLAGRVMQAFMMDYHMGIQADVGLGKTVLQQYTEALAAQRVASVQTGSGFLLASDDVQAGILAVQGMLRLRPDGTPRLRVMRERLDRFEHEVKVYHRKRVAGKVTAAPDTRKDNHLMDCLRYMALHEPRYVARKGQKARPGAALAAFRAKREKERREAGGNYTSLEPGGRPW